MARTYRRRRCWHEYIWVLVDWQWDRNVLGRTQIDRRSVIGRRLLARYHSDAYTGCGAPHWYCRLDSRRIKHRDKRILRHWLSNPDFEPVFQNKHYHNARWSWW
ncbi:MAG: hypothetical protein ACYC9J_12975 [Sulfuricaulis sp.]